MQKGLSGLVARWGRSGFALAFSLVWALPLSAWAGSVDLNPTPLTWIAFWLGLLMLILWLALLVWASRVPVPPRPRRFEVAQMGSQERAWMVGFVICALGVIGWLNAAATVDLGQLATLLRSGRAPAMTLGTGLIALLPAFVAGAFLTWKQVNAHYQARRSS